jgi:hypothetical protein
MAARGLGLLGMALLLAACGGGGGGSSGGGSIGSATPQGGLVLPASTHASSLIAESGTSGGLRIVQQSSGGTSSVSFGGSSQTWRSGVSRIGDLGVYQTTDGTRAVVTSSGGSSSAAAISSLSYTSYGVWLETSASGTLTSTSDQITGAGGFVIGDPTPPSDMPTVGSASYSGQAVAVELRNGQVPRTLSGTFDATADFSNGRVTASADLDDAVSGAAFGRVTMNGLAISGNQFSGSASAGSLSGSVEGGFAGPAAAEIGGSFELTGASTVHGAFAGSSR